MQQPLTRVPFGQSNSPVVQQDRDLGKIARTLAELASATGAILALVDTDDHAGQRHSPLLNSSSLRKLTDPSFLGTLWREEAAYVAALHLTTARQLGHIEGNIIHISPPFTALMEAVQLGKFCRKENGGPGENGSALKLLPSRIKIDSKTNEEALQALIILSELSPQDWQEKHLMQLCAAVDSSYRTYGDRGIYNPFAGWNAQVSSGADSIELGSANLPRILETAKPAPTGKLLTR